MPRLIRNSEIEDLVLTLHKMNHYMCNVDPADTHAWARAVAELVTQNSRLIRTFAGPKLEKILRSESEKTD